MCTGGYCALCFNIAAKLLLSLQGMRLLVHWFLFFIIVLSCCFSLGPLGRAFFQDLLILKDEDSTFL